ncbi:glycosyl hydrolase family 28-related protein [Paenibacillus sp. M2]|uniref:glycosyl hydrolase family 28-related protein n=1 Tax=Paenibacillus sp. M2 TaxID=3341793 RepID=UPI003988D8C6
MAEIQNIPINEKLRDSNPKVNQNFKNINDQLVEHIDSNAAHDAKDITYTGTVPADNASVAIDSINGRISQIVSQAGDDNTEIVDSRGGYSVLGDRLSASDSKLVNKANRRWFDIKDYGAVGDGIADDTASIAQALQEIKTSGGGVLYIPKGVYNNGNTISLPSNTIVQGAGNGTTIIKVKGSATSANVFFMSAGTEKVVIKDLTIDGNKANQAASNYAILGYKAAYCTLDNVSIINQFGIGVGWSNSHHMTCRNVTIERCGDNKPGFWCEFDDNTSPWNTGFHTYENCESNYNDLDGFIFNCPNIKFINCKANYNGQNIGGGGALGAGGFYNDRSQSNVKFITCEANNNTEFGINAVLVNALISNGSFNENILSGICIRSGSGRIKILGCDCVNNGRYSGTPTNSGWGKAGIQFTGVAFLTITACGCYGVGSPNTQTYGIQSINTEASDFVAITGNNLKYNVNDDSNMGPGHTQAEHNITNLKYDNNI